MPAPEEEALHDVLSEGLRVQPKASQCVFK